MFATVISSITKKGHSRTHSCKIEREWKEDTATCALATNLLMKDESTTHKAVRPDQFATCEHALIELSSTGSLSCRRASTESKPDKRGKLMKSSSVLQ